MRLPLRTARIVAATAQRGGPWTASGLLWSVAGWTAAVALFFPFFALGGLGAGDVKLLGALGAWFGASNVLVLVLSSALAGGVAAVAVAVAHGYLGTALRNLQMLLAFWAREGIRPHPELTLGAASGVSR